MFAAIDDGIAWSRSHSSNQRADTLLGQLGRDEARGCGVRLVVTDERIGEPSSTSPAGSNPLPTLNGYFARPLSRHRCGLNFVPRCLLGCRFFTLSSGIREATARRFASMRICE